MIKYDFRRIRMAKWEARLGCNDNSSCICCRCVVFWCWIRSLFDSVVGENVFKLKFYPKYKEKALLVMPFFCARDLCFRIF